MNDQLYRRTDQGSYVPIYPTADDLLGANSAKEVYECGYAISVYDILTDQTTWRFKDEVFSIPTRKLSHILRHPNFGFVVEKIEKIGAAA